jgi:hypothetical protein
MPRCPWEGEGGCPVGKGQGFKGTTAKECLTKGGTIGDLSAR